MTRVGLCVCARAHGVRATMSGHLCTFVWVYVDVDEHTYLKPAPHLLGLGGDAYVEEAYCSDVG